MCVGLQTRNGMLMCILMCTSRCHQRALKCAPTRGPARLWRALKREYRGRGLASLRCALKRESRTQAR